MWPPMLTDLVSPIPNRRKYIAAAGATAVLVLTLLIWLFWVPSEPPAVTEMERQNAALVAENQELAKQVSALKSQGASDEKESKDATNQIPAVRAHSRRVHIEAGKRAAEIAAATDDALRDVLISQYKRTRTATDRALRAAAEDEHSALP